MKKTQISVVIPTLNEEATIEKVIKSVEKHADEIIVIDGHSTDSTKKISLKNHATFIYDDGLGKGCAIRKAIKGAAHGIILFIDGDGSHNAADIPKLIKPILQNKADLVIGSRMTGGSDELFHNFSEFIRLFGSMIITLAINYRWNVRLSDTQNGFRAIRKEIGNRLNLTANSTTIEQEMVMKALNCGYRVINVPSHEFKRKGGISKILVRKTWWKYILNAIANLSTIPKKNKNSSFPSRDD